MELQKVLLWIFSILCLTSCKGETVSPSRTFSAYLLEESKVPALPIHNPKWRVVADTEDELPIFEDIEQIIYSIRYNHVVDSVSFPKGAEIHFDGGHISGILHFDDNYLSGKVNLRQSKLSGTITNQQVEAGWVCYGDCLHDDAWGINQILKLCKIIHFQRGTYLMESEHQIMEGFPNKYRRKVKSHIGIYQQDIKLIGDEGACIYTQDTLKTICIYNMPKDLDHCVRNIAIEGLTFRNVNDRQKFHEFEHTIKVAGVDGLEIKNCQFFDFRGDAICLSHLGNSIKTGELSRNSNVRIVGNYIEGSSHFNRNGISIISGKNVLIEGNIIEETSKSNMPGSIDIEANGPAYTVEDITITNNKISGSKKSGISIYSNSKGAPAYRINVINNEISNCRLGIHIVIKSQHTTSDFIIQDNRITNCHKPLCFTGTGESSNWEFSNNLIEGTIIQKIPSKIKVDNLIVE